MKRSPSKSWRHQKELLVPKQSIFAKFSGVTILKKKQLGNEKMNSEKTTHTYLLANPNLKGEIHLKGVRLVTSQIFAKNLKFCTHEIIASSYAYAPVNYHHMQLCTNVLTFPETKPFPLIKQ
jgi:hypothetical protein